MPYIKESMRSSLDYTIISLAHRILVGENLAGNLNYSVSKMIEIIIKEKGLNYFNINEIIGSLECIKLELYRRVAAPYEDMKIKENGDVYDS